MRESREMLERWREWRVQGREPRERCREGQSLTSRVVGCRAASTAGQVWELENRKEIIQEVMVRVSPK